MTPGGSRGGTEWRHSSLSAPEALRNANPKPEHCCSLQRAPEMCKGLTAAVPCPACPLNTTWALGLCRGALGHLASSWTVWSPLPWQLERTLGHPSIQCWSLRVSQSLSEACFISGFNFKILFLSCRISTGHLLCIADTVLQQSFLCRCTHTLKKNQECVCFKWEESIPGPQDLSRSSLGPVVQNFPRRTLPAIYQIF